MSVPLATMRLQFNRAFAFGDAIALIPYFSKLGISHIYTSPIMAARPGSTHGYDTIDPTKINPELGGEEDFRRLANALQGLDMGLIIDIVPNHMAIGADNPWWMDVLARGRASPFSKYFDIDWDVEDPRLRGKVLLPVLGKPYGEALAAGEINLRRDGALQPQIHYFNNRFPLSPASANWINETVPDALDFAVSAVGLHQVLEQQNYKLTWWRFGNDVINWRRFFDINELAALRIEDDDVFEAVHGTIFRLYAEGLIDGLRVDHIDGLAQPGDYCRKVRTRLNLLRDKRPQSRFNGSAYFVVEKILARAERLPVDWDTDGTTGYDFMDEVNLLQHDEAGCEALTAFWSRISGRSGTFGAEEKLARRQILERSFSAQREALVSVINQIAQADVGTRDFTRSAIRRCVTEILVHFPVYRIYARVNQASISDSEFMLRAVAAAHSTCLPNDRVLVETLGRWLSGAPIRSGAEDLQSVALARFQQLSAPLCAKAVEDTAFYRYGRLISRNDVGFDVRQFASSPARFHERMKIRVEHLPTSMLATATHDHKRGEDARARLAVLSEMPREWEENVSLWLRQTSPYRAAKKDGTWMPSDGDIAILLQTIVGAWPTALRPSEKAELALYAKRIAAWQQKALREAKLYSEWGMPNEQYERAANDFITKLFSDPLDVVNAIAHFAHRCMAAGAVNGLTQLLLKLTVPGTPDIYQGTEFWDLSLVDPDNRAPVDFALRQKKLRDIAVDDLLLNWRDGRIKQYVMWRTLAARRGRGQLFTAGAYLPLETVGSLSDRLVAFARIRNESCAIIVVSRLVGSLIMDDCLSLPDATWGDTRVVVPAELQNVFSDVFTKQKIVLRDGVCAAQILGRLPVAFLMSCSE